MSDVRFNYAFVRTVTHGGPHPGWQPVGGRLCTRQAAWCQATQLGC